MHRNMHVTDKNGQVQTRGLNSRQTTRVFTLTILKLKSKMVSIISVSTLLVGTLVLVGLVNAGPLVVSEKSSTVSTDTARSRQRRQAGGCGCDAIVYDGTNFGGRSLLIRQQNAKFRNDFLNDRVESIQISGTCSYLFYEHDDFLGRSFLLRPGSYSSPQTWGGSGNYISSARALPPKGTNAITLFEHSSYTGRMLTLYSSQSYLPGVDFNDHISSMIVVGGYWTVYDHTAYQGHSARIGPGHYPEPALGHDRISSVRSG